MTFLDYFVLLVVLVSVASGATKGIIRVIVSVAFAVAGVILAALLYSYAAALLRVFVAAWLANLLGFVLVFTIVVVAGAVLSWRLRRGFQRARHGWIDPGLGGAFWLVRGWLICSAGYFALTAFSLRPEAVGRAIF